MPRSGLPASGVRLSVIIPTRNRAAMVRRTVSALARQTLPRNDLEIVVVDDGSDAETRRALREQRESFDLFVEKENGGLASARNAGADRARGAVLWFLDDDVVPAPDAAEQHLRSHAEAPDPVAVVGSLPFPDEIKRDAFLWYLERSGHYDLYANPRKYPGGQPPMPPMNGNSSIRRDVFMRVGRYDESFRQYGSEDLDLGYRLSREGIRFVYNPHAIGYHHHLKDFPHFCDDMERAGESLIRVYRKHPDIKAPKKIDVVEDRLGSLPPSKALFKLVMSATLAVPWVLALPRVLIRSGSRFYALRHLLFPMYRWIGHYHYAVGMRRELATSR